MSAEDNTNSLKDNLRLVRKSLKLTQKELADKSGVSRSTIQLYEKGIGSPTLDTVIKLETALREDGMNIGENIKKYRTDKGISQRELGRQCNITGQCIQMIEAGKVTNPTLSVLESMSKFLEVGIPKLLGYEEQKGLEEYTTDELIKELFRRCK